MKLRLEKLFDFIKKIAVIAVPVALQNLLMTTESIIDTMMLAPMGEKTIASVGLCASFAGLMFSCYWGFACGGTLFFSQHWGAGDEKAIKKNFGVTLSFMMIVGILFSALAFFSPATVMRLYTDKDSLHGVGIIYLRIVAPAYLMQVYSACMCSLLRATEKVKIPLYSGAITSFVNVGLNYVLIYGKLGFKQMGVIGAAYATLIASAVNVLLIWILAKASGYKLLFDIRNHFMWNKDTVVEYLKKCLPIICNEAFMGIANMIIAVVLGRQEEQVIAALVVFRIIESCIVAFFTGFSNAASVLVGKCVGAGDFDTAKYRARRLVPLCAGTIAVVELVIYLVHTPIFHAMGLYGESFEICTVMIIVYSIAAVIRMSNWIQNDTFRSAGDARYGTILEITFMYLFVLPLVGITGLVIKDSFVLLFVACYIDEPIRFVLMQIHMYSNKWINPVTEIGKAALVKRTKMCEEIEYENIACSNVC